jgi:hypothetical protein
MNGANGRREPGPRPYWWAGVASVLPRLSAVPRTGNHWIDRWNGLRWKLRWTPVFPPPNVSRERARSLAKPTCTGFGDLLCAWMMPMTVADLMGWRLRIPVPRGAGGVRENPQRARLTPEWFRSKLTLPAHVELVEAEAAPDDCEWFCTVEQQWYLNACMETSFDTIPRWLRRDGIDRATYYRRYRGIARALVRPNGPAFFGGRTPFIALHVRGGDRGPGQEELTLALLRVLARDFKQWVVVSESPAARERMTVALRELGCEITRAMSASEGPAEAVWGDFEAMVKASGVVSSVGGGWSAFPYAATRISGAPLLVASEYAASEVWRLLMAHSKVDVLGIRFGESGAERFREDVRRWAVESTCQGVL